MSQILDLLFAPFRALVAAPRKLLGFSLPARIAFLVALFLALCVTTAYVAFAFSQNRADLQVWLRPGRIATLAALLIVIPFVVYYTLRLWLEGDVSRFPDIDYAWKAGLQELERQGLDITQIPIFLILGTTGESQEVSLFESTRESFRVKQHPQGNAALHWYAHPDAVYVCCTEVGQLSKLAVLGEKAGERPLAAPTGGGEVAAGGAIRGTLVGVASTAESRDAITSSSPQLSPGTAGGASTKGFPASGNIYGTMIAGTQEESDLPTAVAAAPARGPVMVSVEEANEQQRRVEYLCQQIRRVRKPLCPINGVLTLLPYGLIQRGPREGIEVQKAVKADLATVRGTLKLRCPVTALVVGLDQEGGFRELVRRVGLERARAQRFGKGFNIWGPPAGTQLESLALHACGSFEDWVYTLFREPGALEKPGNTRLYALLCKIRHNVQSRLSNILVSAYGQDPEAGVADPLLFGGCYFAAVGQGEGRQAFVKGVLDKLVEQQGELEWTEDALRAEQRYRTLAYSGFLVDLLLLGTLATGLVYKFWR